MSEHETPITDNAKLKPAVRKAKSKTKAKKAKRGNTHEGRPKKSQTYWVKAIEGNRLRGPELFYAIRKVEEYEREKKAKQSAKANPEQATKLRLLLRRAGERQTPAEPKVVSNPVTVAKLEEMPISEPVPVESVSAEPELTIDDLVAEITKPSGKTHAEEVAEMVKRIREVPAPEQDSATETRIWAAVHGMKVH